MCARIVQATLAAAQDPQRSNHDRLRAILSLVNEGIDDIGRIFDRASRSRCFEQLVTMRGAGLLTDEELEVLTPETRRRIGAVFEGVRSDRETRGAAP